jgi:hypothetical protein
VSFIILEALYRALGLRCAVEPSFITGTPRGLHALRISRWSAGIRHDHRSSHLQSISRCWGLLRPFELFERDVLLMARFHGTTLSPCYRRLVRLRDMPQHRLVEQHGDSFFAPLTEHIELWACPS